MTWTACYRRPVLKISRAAERWIFLIHGVVTVAAGVVLALLPATIPQTVGIETEPSGYLLAYLLAAAQLGIGALSIGAARLSDPAAIRLIAASFAVFHGVTAVLEVVYLAMQGVSAVLVANAVVRLIACAAFVLVALSRRA